MSIILSILVLTVPSRIDFFYPRLMKSLSNQTKKYSDIEVLALFDNKKRTIGRKRQDLINLSQGKYVVFIDDDDRIADDYVDEIRTTLHNNPDTDCVVFDQFITIDGDMGRRARYSIEYENFTREGNELRAKPPHTCVYKSSIAKKHPYSDMNSEEDINWINRACVDIKVQTRIDKILYYYDAEYNKISETQGLSDATIQKHVALKFENDLLNSQQHALLKLENDLLNSKKHIAQLKLENDLLNSKKRVMPELGNDLLNSQKYTITVAVTDEEMATPVINSLSGLDVKILIGKNYPSFSKLVNTVIANSEEEIVIFCSHKVRPTKTDVLRILELLNKGYGLVGLYRLAFFGIKKELIRRIGFMDERFMGKGYGDNDFVIRLMEANIAYYESESVMYEEGPSTWNYNMTKPFFEAKWHSINGQLCRRKPELFYDYDLGINYELKNIETSKLFLPWAESDSSTSLKSSTVQLYIHKAPIKDTMENIIPIHLRNIPPPMETFDHIRFLSDFAKWLKPNLYVEFGVRNGVNIAPIAAFCKTIHSIDVHPISWSLQEKHPHLIPFVMTTDNYVSNILNRLPTEYIIDMAFIDADHESDQAFKDFEGIFPYVMENGFIFLHDTYPYAEYMTRPEWCNDCYKVPYKIKNKYSNYCEIVTLPFNPGLTIVKKTISSSPAFLNPKNMFMNHFKYHL